MADSPKLGVRVAVLGVESASGELGGAEAFYRGLVRELGHQVESVEFIAHSSDESTFQNILANYDYWRNLDLSRFDLVISTKAPTYAVTHPNHLLYLVHTVRAYYDMFDAVFPEPTSEHVRQQAQIHSLDEAAFRSVRHVYCIGEEVARRVRKWNRLAARTLHPALLNDHFHGSRHSDYFLVPGRLHPWKRVDLAVAAFKRTALDCELRIVGVGEAERELRRIAGDDERIRFLGRVSDEELVQLYSNCAAVIFLPKMEDFGYITLEAFSSEKPVITCTDSGEPLQFVKHDVTGKVAEPTVESVATAMEEIWLDKKKAAVMGRAGKQRISQINWPDIVRELLQAGLSDNKQSPVESLPRARLLAAVLDMQPIEPPVGGGRLRLLGLYHDMDGQFCTEYVGSYDWPGEKWRRIEHSSTLTETTIPLSSEHYKAAGELSRQVNNKTVIDLAFPRLGYLSGDYLEFAIDQVTRSDVVVFSHPWVFPLVARYLRPDQLVVYDSHNVEGYLRAQFLEKNHQSELQVLREVVQAEYRLLKRADLVLACSQDDLELFVSVFEIDPALFRVVPNGVMTSAIAPANVAEKAQFKSSLGIDSQCLCAIFIGSNYGPNLEAARFIAEDLAARSTDILFVIAGGVGEAIRETACANVVLTGSLSEEEKLRWLKAADIAVNPMFGGSGTNIKMFDFLAAGLPTITTPVGARGIPYVSPRPYLKADPVDFPSRLRELAGNSEMRQSLSRNSRQFVEQHFSWERISRTVGKLLARSYLKHGREPYFTVVVPSYERPKELAMLLSALERQTLGEFEVIVVDQSSVATDVSRYALDIEYCHTDVRGAIHARNYGAALAAGEYLAFIDDDCIPHENWLENARKHIDSARGSLVGIEGEIVCPEVDRSKYRVVTNIGGRGLYMTANLFASARAFRLAGGFDMMFDNPHFREDTDFGWRLERLGSVLRAQDVVVTHPAVSKDNSRDSDSERDRFFEKDALLYKKHPDKYKELFLFEAHYKNTPGFWPNFLKGAEKYEVTLDDYFSPFRPADNAG